MEIGQGPNWGCSAKQKKKRRGNTRITSNAIQGDICGNLISFPAINLVLQLLLSISSKYTRSQEMHFKNTYF
jgi:hypothetical protein